MNVSTVGPVLVAERRARGWGRERLAHEFERAATRLGFCPPERSAMIKAIYRHETGRVELRDPTYLRLYCAVYDLTPQELLGSEYAGNSTCDATQCAVTAHRFIPVHVDPQRVALSEKTVRLLDFDCWRYVITRDNNSANLFIFPWGIAVMHLDDELTFSDLASIAFWRRSSGPSGRAWTTDTVRRAVDPDCESAEYAMSLFWVDSLPWSGSTRSTAMRLLAMPRVLLGRTAESAEPSIEHAQQVEKALLRDGFIDSRIDEFGMQGISVGCASWAAVAYCALSPRRALEASDLVDLEVVVQAVWAFCHRLRQEAESGDEPVVLDGFGWRWLRGVRSRLMVARPNESAQHAAMRQAIVGTSGLADQLSEAIDLLRDAERN